MTKLILNNVTNLQNENTACTLINDNSANIVAAVDNTLSRDGSSPNEMGANLDMNSNRIINLPDPIDVSEPVPLSLFNTIVAAAGNVPAGGSTGQSLIKSSNASFATAWGTPVINLSGPIASIGPVTTITSQTGSGTTFAMSVAPTITGHPTIEGVTSTGATGTGKFVFDTAPTLGAVTATSVNKLTLTQPATGSTLTIPDGVVLTGPAATGTIVTKTSTDTLTNKTLDSAGTGNVLQVGSVTLSKGQYPAETTTGNATAGNVGEYVSSSVAFGSAVSLTGGVTANITSISLTAGDWDVQAMPRITGAASTTVARVSSSISLTSATNSATPGNLSDQTFNVTTPFATCDPTIAIPTVRISVASTTTVYLTINVGFGTSTCSAYGFISARRAR